MKKKRNNQSKFVKDWTTKKLKREAVVLNDLIHGQNACYGTKDIIVFDLVVNELSKRGCDVHPTLSFD